jgi:hypothetical protein
MTSPKPLKVGFDLDGVLLYNPARIVRPIIKTTKNTFRKSKKTSFYIPQSKWQKTMWKVVHKSSLFQAPGIDIIKSLVAEKKIEAYIITARFDCLKDDYDHWIKKLNQDHKFTACYANFSNSQPHIYKEKMIKQLKLDIFIDDNWDIISHLNQSFENTTSPPKMLWITNIFDRSIQYSHKHNSLRSAIGEISANLEKA